MASRPFQNALNKAIKSATLPKNILAFVIRQKLLDFGIKFNKKQYSKLVAQLEAFEDTGSLNFTLSDKQIRHSQFHNEKDLNNKVQACLTTLSDDIEQYIEKFGTVLPEVIQEVVKKSSETLYKKHKKIRKDVISDHLAIQLGFELNLEKLWGKAFSALEALIGCAMESGQLWYENLHAKQADTHKTQVLIAMHARCCQITGEILALIKTGFADGAYARWRSLHEVSVVAFYLIEHNDDTAARYYFHQDIDLLNQLESEQHRFASLQTDCDFQEALTELRASRKQLLDEYGKDFSGDYGWAAKTLGKQKPTFRDIETSVDMSFLRPYYKEASLNIHANSRGAFFRIGSMESATTLLAGRSNLGLSSPGRLASMSLSQITIHLLTSHNPDLDQLVYAKVIGHLQKEAIREFDSAALKLSKSIQKSISDS